MFKSSKYRRDYAHKYTDRPHIFLDCNGMWCFWRGPVWDDNCANAYKFCAKLNKALTKGGDYGA